MNRKINSFILNIYFSQNETDSIGMLKIISLVLSLLIFESATAKSCLLCYILGKHKTEMYTYVIRDLHLLENDKTGEAANRELTKQCEQIKNEKSKKLSRTFDYSVTIKYLNTKQTDPKADYANGLVSEFDINDKFAHLNSNLNCDKVKESKYLANVEYSYPYENRTQSEISKQQDEAHGYGKPVLRTTTPSSIPGTN